MPLSRLPFLLVLAVVMTLVVIGCVSEADRSEASRFRRPAMPAMAGGPGATPLAPAEATVLASVLRQAGAGDLAGAARTLEAMGDRGARERLARTVATSLAATRPLEAVALGLKLAPGLAQTAALEVGARALARREGDFALRWAIEFPDPAAAIIVRRVVADERVAVAPRATVDRLWAQPADAARDQMLGLAGAAWARRDNEGAEAWLRELPAGEVRQRLTAQIGFEIAQTNPRRAIKLAEALAPGRDRWLLITAITQTWVAVDAKAAFAWTHQLSAGEAHTAAIAGLDAGLGIAVARRGAVYPDTQGGAQRRRAGGTVAEVVAAGDDARFAAWWAEQASGRSHDEAMIEYVRQRGALEPLSIGQWVAGLPGGSARDRALEVFWETLVTVSPPEAARWLGALPRSDRPNERVERTAREWLRTDPAAAAAWLRASSLPPDQIEGLLRQWGQP